MGKSPFDQTPFNFHDRPDLILKYQMAGADLSYFPIGWGFKPDAVPGDLFPMISQFFEYRPRYYVYNCAILFGHDL